MDRSLKVLWFLVSLGIGTAQYYPNQDFSLGCTVPSDSYGPPVLLPPFLCHLVVRESARALGLLEPFVTVPNYDQVQQSASRALSPILRTNCDPPTTAARAIDSRKLQSPPSPTPVQTARFLDCNQQPLHESSRAIDCNEPFQTARALDCNVFPTSPDCQPPPQPPARLVECSRVPAPAGWFLGCGPPVLPVQDAEPVMPQPCPQICNSLCAGCQPNNQPSAHRVAETAMVDLNQGGRAISEPPKFSYNLIPVKLKPKTPGADDQMNHLLLLQLKSDNEKVEKEEASKPKIGRPLLH